MDAVTPKTAVTPFVLKDAPSLIQKVWPAQKISVETFKERDAKQAQTLTSLGSYWKGRKPLILARACILASLLPASDDVAGDLEIFDLLMGMHDDQIGARLKVGVTAADVEKFGSESQKQAFARMQDSERPVARTDRDALSCEIISQMPYQDRVERLYRLEELPEDPLLGPYFARINAKLGTSATTLTELIEQLGIMRFGRRPRVADTFAGGGSIPFEAARIGCDVFASDLNPVAAMLTWGALNVVGATPAHLKSIEKSQKIVADLVENDLKDLGFEYDETGNRVKTLLYCLETRCPQTGWMVPMAPTWVISKSWKTIAVLVPDAKSKRYEIEIRSGVSDSELKAAEKGTIQKGNLVHTVAGETYSTSIKAIRGDFKDAAGVSRNRLRQWEVSDVVPRPDDILQERLIAIQWMDKETLQSARPRSFFASVTEADRARERKAIEFVEGNLAHWQDVGLVPDMPIETGKENEGPIRTNGWTHWHHLFSPLQLIFFATLSRHVRRHLPTGWLDIARLLDRSSKVNRWSSSNGSSGQPTNVFDTQALNTFFNYGAYASYNLIKLITKPKNHPIGTDCEVGNQPAAAISVENDIYVTDPPYADSVRYEEITEFFIAWLRKKPPAMFENFIWDSRRALAIKGDGEEFKKGMIDAYKAMADHMPANGLQIVMFTHQSASVWADMALIFWGAGLQVVAAWYIATEVSSELKKGGYVQGTVILVLRKRIGAEHAYKDEIVQEVKSEVSDQIDTMSGLNQDLVGHGRIENLFEDADLQMAGYAAALRVLTRYSVIDGIDMTKESLRPRRIGEKSLVGEVIEFAVQVANEHMVPDPMDPKLWGGLSGAERFYFKMMDVETTTLRKLDNYQNFAKAFRVGDYAGLMGSVEPNKARLKLAREFKKNSFEIPDFGPSATRAVLYALFEIGNDVEGDEVLAHLRDMVPGYMSKRDDLAAMAEYIVKKREKVDETESRAARILHGLIRNERLG
ncbi:anti-phage-associated DUF1156 domain-containing protein [Bradyrhizobium sp. 187]|uniref:anti-phage-associated DUF1156 domain-containing protein n=1 Tax=Bradyrhizobium sp. 187 TaxID=2782655 RepID=UPI001FFF715F|nr:anti-phage-associated DUF1156 domain-containing protein [Bradyrhizobium sp. 187]UPJ73542.1 DUF1156 domain-containing protein [Bradyrhizobium sp. 187]